MPDEPRIAAQDDPAARLPEEPMRPAVADPVTRRLPGLDPGTVAAVRALAETAAETDGAEALSEAFRLALGPPRAGVVHLLRYAASPPTAPSGPRLAGYAQVAGTVAELVVAPADRREGHGSALVEAALSVGAEAFWAHGDLPASRALAARHGLVAVRTLHRMARPLMPEDRIGTGDAGTLGFPGWVRIETYAEHPDVEMLQRLNAAAFAGHPEQGRLTVADLRERMAEAWFDPAGLFLFRDADAARDADPVGFHWTKAIPGSPTGEVYVVGIHPEYQGRGLAGPLTRLGLAHLAGRGLREVELYVDGENIPAVATYRRLGFDVVESHIVHRVRPAAGAEPT